MKRIVCMLAFIFLLGALTGCGNPSHTESSQETEGKTNQSAEPANGNASPSEVHSEWDQVLAAAKEETLHLITHPGERDTEFVEKFKAAYPDIKVEHAGLRPSEAAPRVITEHQNDQFYWDVMVASTSNQVNVMSPAGVFQDIRPYLPEQSDNEWLGDGYQMFAQNESNKPWTFIFATDLYSTLHVNREFVSKEEFNSLDDFLDPKFKGKIVFDKPDKQSGGSLSVAGLLNAKDESFLEALLVDQEPVFADDKFTATNWLADGRYPIAVGADKSRIDELQEAGIGTEIERLSFPGLSTLARGVSVFNNNPSPNATKVFLHWFLSHDGQKAYATSLKWNSRRKDVDVVDEEVRIDWADYNNYSLQGTEAGADDVMKVIEMYKKHY